jgi:hypothetical protein
MSITRDGLFMSNTASSTSTGDVTRSGLQRLYAVWHDSKDLYHQPQKAFRHLLLDTDRLAAVMLTPTVHRHVFGPGTSEVVTGARVTACNLQTLVELSTGTRGQLLFFFSVAFTVQGYEQQLTGSVAVHQTGYLHAILLWSDPTLLSASHQQQLLSFHIPCPACAVPPCDMPPPSEGCRPGLDTVLFLAQLGTFVHIEDEMYLHVPSDDNPFLPLQFVQISPTGITTVHPAKPPARFASLYNPSLHITRQAGPSPSRGQTPYSSAKTGAWTRADVFALSGLSARLVTSPILHPDPKFLLRWIQATQPNPASSQWFAEMRVLKTGRNQYVLRSFASQNVSATAKLSTQCSPYSCQVRAHHQMRTSCSSILK